MAGGDTSRRPPFLHRAVDFALDRLLAPVRPLLAPVHFGMQAAGAASAALWLLANEYRKRHFARCGEGVRIHGRFTVTAPERLHLGDNVHINTNAFLRAEGGLYIGDNVHISRNLVVYTMNHDYAGECLPYDHNHVPKPVRIDRNVWIGMNVVVTPGVTIGEGAIVGMGAVVAKDVEPLAIVGSAPQRVLKHRDPEHYAALEAAGRYGGMSGYPRRRP